MKEESYISQNYKGKVYYQLPFIDRYMEDNEWKMFTVLFNHIMTVTKHDSIKTKPIPITHEWLAEKVGKSEKTSQRVVDGLCKLGVVKVYKGDYKSNKYELNWDVINTLAECQEDKEDKNVALSEVKNVSYIEDIFVPLTEDRNVSQIINKNKSYNKKYSKRNTKPAGTNTKSIRVSASEVEDIPYKVLSSAEGNRLAEARSNSNRATNPSAAHNPRHSVKKAQHNPIEVSETTAANSHSPIVGQMDEATNTHNLQSSVALAPSHPPIAPTPLSPIDEKVIALCDKLFNNPNDFTSGQLEFHRGNLNAIYEQHCNRLAPLAVSSIERTVSHLDYLLN